MFRNELQTFISCYLDLLYPWPFPSLLMATLSFYCSHHKLWRYACLISITFHIQSGFSYKRHLESDHLAITPLISLWSEASSFTWITTIIGPFASPLASQLPHQRNPDLFQSNNVPGLKSYSHVLQTSWEHVTWANHKI